MLLVVLAGLLTLLQEKAPAPEIRSGTPLALEIAASDPPIADKGPARAVRFLDALPRTHLGKVDRGKLRLQ